MNGFLVAHIVKYNGYLVDFNNKILTAKFKGECGLSYKLSMRIPPSTDLAVYNQVVVNGEYVPLIDLIKNNDHSLSKKNY